MRLAPLTHLDALETLLLEGGHDLYSGEAVSQLEHALQAAAAAEQAGSGAALITAALLHDVGHLASRQQASDLAAGIDDHHEALAVQLLHDLFDHDVLQPIALHVAAKRYLASTEPGYLDNLSPASTCSLALQGGPMSEEEAARFRLRPNAAQAIALRRFDELAKVPNLPTPPLSHYLAIAATVMKACP